MLEGFDWASLSANVLKTGNVCTNIDVSSPKLLGIPREDTRLGTKDVLPGHSTNNTLYIFVLAHTLSLGLVNHIRAHLQLCSLPHNILVSSPNIHRNPPVALS